MKWADVRKKYIDEWLIIEAINARTEDSNRIVEELTVVDTFNNNNNAALRKYVELHKVNPERELYVVHTSRGQLNIKERRWTGVRGAQ